MCELGPGKRCFSSKEYRIGHFKGQFFRIMGVEVGGITSPYCSLSIPCMAHGTEELIICGTWPARGGILLNSLFCLKDPRGEESLTKDPEIFKNGKKSNNNN